MERTTPRRWAPTRSAIVDIAERELNDDSRNYEIGENRGHYGGKTFGWPACGGKSGTPAPICVTRKPDGTLWLYPNNIERDNGVRFNADDARQVGRGRAGFNLIV